MKLFECGLYGQPIIRYDNRYLIACVAFRTDTGGNRMTLIDAETGAEKTYRRGQIDNTGLTANFHENIIYWDTLKSSRLKFPGLAGYQTNGYTGEGNPFNFESNY